MPNGFESSHLGSTTYNYMITIAAIAMSETGSLKEKGAMCRVSILLDQANANTDQM